MGNKMVNNIKNIPEKEGVVEMVRYIESYYEPIIKRGRGMSFGQNVYILGIINEYAFIKTGDKKYLEAAEKYFKQGQTLGPKRPQGLYGLLDIYKLKGDLVELKKVADQVLSQWPEDAMTRKTVDEILKVATTTAKE